MSDDNRHLRFGSIVWCNFPYTTGIQYQPPIKPADTSHPCLVLSRFHSPKNDCHYLLIAGGTSLNDENGNAKPKRVFDLRLHKSDSFFENGELTSTKFSFDAKDIMLIPEKKEWFPALKYRNEKFEIAFLVMKAKKVKNELNAIVTEDELKKILFTRLKEIGLNLSADSVFQKK